MVIQISFFVEKVFRNSPKPNCKSCLRRDWNIMVVYNLCIVSLHGLCFITSLFVYKFWLLNLLNKKSSGCFQQFKTSCPKDHESYKSQGPTKESQGPTKESQGPTKESQGPTKEIFILAYWLVNRDSHHRLIIIPATKGSKTLSALCDPNNLRQFFHCSSCSAPTETSEQLKQSLSQL